MTYAEQIRLITAILCVSKIWNTTSKDNTIQEAQRLAEKIYHTVPVDTHKK